MNLPFFGKIENIAKTNFQNGAISTIYTDRSEKFKDV
jgi:hypothetical protein